MHIYRLLRSGISVVAAAVLGLWLGSSGAFAEMKLQGGSAAGPAVAKPGQPAKSGHVAWLYGRPAYEYKGAKFLAPAPAVSLKGIESKQWRSDYLKLKFDKLRDRQLLYAYYLTSLDGEKAKANKAGDIIAAVKAAAKAQKTKGKPLRIAIGVEYDIMEFLGDKDVKLVVEPVWLRWVAVPVKWSEKSHELIKDKHDLKTFAGVVSGATVTLPSRSYANYWSVNGWSGAAKEWQSKLRALAKEKASPDGKAVYAEAIAKGPLKWRDLTPVATFIAVDRMLDIEGLKGKTIVTSKTAWQRVPGK